MTPAQLAEEVMRASRDRRHEDVERFLLRLVALAEARMAPPAPPDPPPRSSLEPSD